MKRIWIIVAALMALALGTLRVAQAQKPIDVHTKGPGGVAQGSVCKLSVFGTSDTQGFRFFSIKAEEYGKPPVFGMAGTGHPDSMTYQATEEGHVVVINGINGSFNGDPLHGTKFRVRLVDGAPVGGPDKYRIEHTPDGGSASVVFEGTVPPGDKEPKSNILIGDHATLSLVNAYMASDSTLKTDVNLTDFTGSRKVTLRVSLRDAEDNTTVVTKDYTVAAGSPESQRLLIDLAEEGVPRFKNNVQFRVTLTLHRSDGSDVKLRSRDAIIYLPVVLIPGYLDGQGGEQSFSEMIRYMRDESNEKRRSQAHLGEGYRTLSDPTDYPTLYALEYDTTAPEFETGASALRDMISDVLARTYAERVELVGFSKGGLIGRQYLTEAGENNGAKVKRFFMIATPNTGTLWARFNVIPRTDWLGDKSLLPVYKSVRSSNKKSFIAYPNAALTALNSRKLPTDTKTAYQLILNDSTTTNLIYKGVSLITGTSVAYTQGQSPMTGTMGRGDGLIPAYSARGREPDMNGFVGKDGQLLIPNQGSQIGPLIEAFQDVPFNPTILVDAPYYGFMNSTPLMKELFPLLSRIN